jgi:hypothetical protein
MMPRAQRLAPEPPEGFEARWAAARTRALRRCRLDPAVLTWAQAVSCALNTAYPEAAPWTDPALGEAWMGDAAGLVERSMTDEVKRIFSTPTPQGWQAMLWLRAEREIHDSNLMSDSPRTPSDTLRRIATSLYPAQPWPPGEESLPWAHRFWDELDTIYRRIR